MSADGSSNIRVFIHWRDQTVFAGEEVKCTITFRNVAQDPNQQQNQSAHGHQQSQSERHRFASPLQGRNKASSNRTPPLSNASGRGHRRAALSLSVPSATTRSRTGSIQWHQPSSAANSSRSNHAHKRSVSIVSIGSTSTIDDHHLQRHDAPPRPHRPRHGHNRASSLQISSRGPPATPATPQGSFSQRHASSPLANASYPPDRFGRVDSGSNSPRPNTAAQRRSPRTSPNPMPEFRFPAGPPSDSEGPQSPQRGTGNGLLSPRPGPSDANAISIRLKDQSIPERPALTARILSSTSMAGGTPRSSGEFYSLSNNSSETLASEYVTQPVARGHGRPQVRRGSLMAAPVQSRTPESIMMGFAQIQGSFSLDSSLVSLAPFEQVKKKAVVGGRGGGVVGIESNRRENGLLRSFGFGGITNSLGDFLGGGELSTIKEMRGAANTKSVPILSTPQSILFVDLHLAPGESRAYEYTFRLPRGLPPTHKGKAIKISYSLVIGTQRAGGAKEQQVRTVEIPFRILGSVDSYGEIPEHDLMNPYILLRDLAQVKTLGKGVKGHHQRERASSTAATGMNDFLIYVDELATRSRDEAGGGLLSPTADANSRRQSVVFEESNSVKEAIRLAIMRSNMTAEGQQSPNRFEIARNGQRVGVVMLTRPAYRLGEVVTMVIDFTDADVPCYAVHATLESTEKVDSSLAIRSESSIQRVTRKVYAASSEATLYTRRVVFTPTIPISATPDFITTGVTFEWKDEKGGLVLVAVENLACESFDVLVPLRVYGAVGTGLERLERDEASEEGLVV
ncbi:RAB6A-GEF complex partner protein 2 [Cladobotryum mycophilum]|uniref:RAB6A-GEF complex partner protein 2 n=1 Tax=Cladobotryum mycophilum TaxID=491253 RepID=A0ABR0T0M2_9HYPO